MRQLTILSGAGVNLGVAHACPFADEMLNFTYQKISVSVYERIDPNLRQLFTPESFDYILGGLLTVNLAIEKTKQDLKRFNVNEQAFCDLFQQTALQGSIVAALEQLEGQLTISLGQMLDVVKAFAPVLDELTAKYDSINYFTVNFDGIFDHILYGPGYSRVASCTDFWRGNGEMNQGANQRIKIHHLHGDLRYKPFKRTKQNNPPYKWPLLVVGDGEVKKGIIASNEPLRFYNNRLRSAMESRGAAQENVLAIVGFGFREEDDHIVSKVRHALQHGIFDRVFLFDPADRLAGIAPQRVWISPQQENLVQFLSRL